MIVVVGTRRSGTSMWMQVLRSAGFPVVGDAFPRDWAARVGEANPRGFFESNLRDGINHLTNPDPRSGARLDPAQTTGWAVKIFAPGLVLTELVWLDHVLLTVRDWRRYCASVLRLEAMERATWPNNAPDPVRRDPAAEWLLENLLVVQDAAQRGYRCRIVAPAAALADPGVVVDTLGWIGLPADHVAAVAAVDPALSHWTERPRPSWVSPHQAAVYDAVEAALFRGPHPSDELIEAATAVIHAAPRRRVSELQFDAG